MYQLVEQGDGEDGDDDRDDFIIALEKIMTEHGIDHKPLVSDIADTDRLERSVPCPHEQPDDHDTEDEEDRGGAHRAQRRRRIPDSELSFDAFLARRGMEDLNWLRN